MGRVVKGARVTTQTYRVGLPAPEPSVASCVAPPAASAAEPDVDLEEVRAHAARLIDEASLAARQQLDDARDRSQRLIDDAQRRVAEMAATSRQSGFDRGVGEGRAAAQAEMDDMLATMRGLIEMARIERHKIVQSAEPEIVRLCVAIAERILNAHLAMTPSAVLDMVRSAITRLVNRETVTVRVNPSDIETMREHREQLMAMNDIDNLRVIEDQRVDRGGVLIETDAGTIDAKISTQLREVRRLLAVEEPITVSPALEHAFIHAPAQAS